MKKLLLLYYSQFLPENQVFLFNLYAKLCIFCIYFIIFMPAQTLLFQGFIHRFLHFILSENFIFFLCRKTSADMTFLFIVLQNLFHLFPQLRIHLLQTLGNVFMFRRDELERFRPSPNPQANAGKYPHSHPCPLRFSG